jgi:hypothetical protein
MGGAVVGAVCQGVQAACTVAKTVSDNTGTPPKGTPAPGTPPADKPAPDPNGALAFEMARTGGVPSGTGTGTPA